jgi:dipeptidyl aminopeptidase/acylaminoacyl peptidase
MQDTDNDVTELIDYEIHMVPVTDGSSAPPFECILSYPAPSKNHGGKLPVIVLPHGGPHSVFAADWKLSVAFLNALGYAVCQGAIGS